MLRVLGTIQHSQYSSNMKEQAKNLTNWVSEIHTGIYPHLVRHCAAIAFSRNLC